MEDLLKRIICEFHEYCSVTFSWIGNLFFANNCLFIILFILAMAFLLYNKESFRNTYSLLIPFTLLFMVSVLFNPVAKSLFLNLPIFPGSGGDVYARFWIVCPVWLLISSMLTLLCDVFRHRLHRFVLIVCLSVVLVFAGSSLTTLNMINEAHNLYKVRAESIDITHTLLELSGNEPVSMLIFMPESSIGENYEDGGTISAGISQYSSNIALYTYSFTLDEWNDCFISDTIPDGVTTSSRYINLIIFRWNQNYDCTYFAFPDDENIIPKLEACGGELVGQAGGYSIFWYSPYD